MKALAILCGIFVWGLATIVAFFAGTLLFLGGPATWIAYVAVVPLVWALLAGFWSVTLVPAGERLAVAAMIVLPGLVLDAVLVLIAPPVFGWPTATAGIFSSWLLWANAAALMVGARADRKVQHLGSANA